MLWFLQNTPDRTNIAMLCFKQQSIFHLKISFMLLGSISVLMLFWQLRNISLYRQTLKLSQKNQIPGDSSDFHDIKNNSGHAKIIVPSQKTNVTFRDRHNNSAKQNNSIYQDVQGKFSSEKEHSRHAVKKESSVLLLMWTHPWGVSSEGPKEGWKSGNCSCTYKRESLEDADAVIFPYMTAPRQWSLPRWKLH